MRKRRFFGGQNLRALSPDLLKETKKSSFGAVLNEGDPQDSSSSANILTCALPGERRPLPLWHESLASEACPKDCDAH